jgi:peptidoglycan/LPS O-acetylase OafA/YrhL
VPEGDHGVRPLREQVLLIIAVLVSLIGGAVLVLTALGYGHADVRGLRLTGGLRLGFLAGLGVAVAGTGAAALGLFQRRRWAVPLLAAVWPAFALVCLALDRLTPAPGPGRPLAFYLIGVGLVPAVLTLLLGQRPRRRQSPPVD